MAETTNTETVTIKVVTIDAVENVGQLKNNIKILKEELQTLTIGTDEYKEKLGELKVNQNALKDAMYATTASMEDIAKAAKGTSQSYNGLVAEMAKYKAELRSTDISTEEGARRFNELAADINRVNLQLKEMDAMQGNFQRNVGNYTSALDDLHIVARNLPPSMQGIKNTASALDKSFKLMSVNPIIGVVALVAPLINKIADGLKENEKATAALQKALKALEPVGVFFEGLLDKIADALTWVVDKVVELAGRSDGAFKKVVSGVTGVGNAIFQFLIAPVKTFIEVVKGAGQVMKDIFTGQWKNIKTDAQAAGTAISDAIQKGWNFKQNYAAGESAADAFVSGLTSSRSKKKAKDAGSAIAKEVKDEFEDIIGDITKDMDKAAADLDKAEAAVLKNALAREKEQLAAIDATAKYRQSVNAATVDDEKKRAEESYRITVEGNEKKLAALRQFQQAAIQRGDLDAYLDYEQQIADTEVEIELAAYEERARIRRKDVEDAEKAAEAKAKVMQAYAKGVGDVLGAIADLYDVRADDDKKAFENSKRFQIAETWVNTLSGMASAIWATWNDKTIPSAIAKAALAATNAAGVLASGIAATAKIRSTQFGGGGGPAAGIVSAKAPAVQTSLPQVLQAQTASDIDRYNRAAEASKVYILQSDIEAAGRAQRVRVAETTF
jgi:hypothetical protein